MRLLNHNCNKLNEQFEVFNNLRVLLAFLLDIGEAVLYHKLSYVYKIVNLDLKNCKIIIDCKKATEVIRELKINLQKATEVEWDISAEYNINAMTYAEFLNALDQEHHTALIQTELVQYILAKFENLKVGKIVINTSYNKH